jgi:hypothetical protein
MGSMLYPEALKSAKSDWQKQKCECLNGHVWFEWFYYDAIDSIWLYSDTAGSTCPYCGEQDVLEH